MESVELANGHRMPMIGLGTWRLTGKRCESAIDTALGLGYRHIDTAVYYQNHREIGRAIRAGCDRSDLFLTSKVSPGAEDYNRTLDECDATLDELGTDYLDLFLIHWPSASVPVEETLRAFEELVATGKVWSIGVSNFSATQLQEAIDATALPISVNQIRFNPYHNPEDLRRVCEESAVVVTGYSPLGEGRVPKDAALDEVARRHGKTRAQVALRWLVRKGVVAIPESSRSERQRENMDVFGWDMTDDDATHIDMMSRA